MAKINDTRLLHGMDDLRTALAYYYDTSRGSFTNREDGDEIRKFVSDLAKLFDRSLELMDPELFTPCRDLHHLGATCIRQSGHGGFHQSRWGQTWTDETDAAAAAAVAKQMEGKRD